MIQGMTAVEGPQFPCLSNGLLRLQEALETLTCGSLHQGQVWVHRGDPLEFCHFLEDTALPPGQATVGPRHVQPRLAERLGSSHRCVYRCSWLPRLLDKTQPDHRLRGLLQLGREQEEAGEVREGVCVPEAKGGSLLVPGSAARSTALAPRGLSPCSLDPGNCVPI